MDERSLKRPVTAGFGRQYRLPPWSVQIQQDNAHPLHDGGYLTLTFENSVWARRVKGSFGFEKRYEGSGFAENTKARIF
jgi:hypothetical protein